LGIGRASSHDVCFVGSSDPGVAKRLGDSFDLDPADDLRHDTVHAKDFSLLVGDPKFSPSILQGTRPLFTLEPTSLGMSDSKPPLMLGTFTQSAGFRSLQQVLEDFGPISSVHFTGHCSEGQGTLYARLHDAFRVIHSLLGTPEMIDGMLVGPTDVQSNQPGRLHADNVSADLTGITGYLGALVRCRPRATATISVSDQLHWQRCLRIMGPSGIVDVMENTLSWSKADGTVIDVGETLESPFAFHCQAVSDQLSEVGSAVQSPSAPDEIDFIMASCEAARLSCRTRAPESSEKVRELLSRT
jgi:hypothetical protein